MRHKPYKGFEPKWVKTPAPADSYRSIFRWGDPEFVKYPKESLFKMMKEKFQMTDEDFKTYAGDIGMDSVKLDRPCPVSYTHLDVYKRQAVPTSPSRTNFMSRCREVSFSGFSTQATRFSYCSSR